jgi:hypothetical protein
VRALFGSEACASSCGRMARSALEQRQQPRKSCSHTFKLQKPSSTKCQLPPPPPRPKTHAPCERYQRNCQCEQTQPPSSVTAAPLLLSPNPPHCAHGVTATKCDATLCASGAACVMPARDMAQLARIATHRGATRLSPSTPGTAACLRRPSAKSLGVALTNQATLAHPPNE